MITQVDSETKTNCFDVAEYILSYAKKKNLGIDNLKLQKLVYYAQAWHLGLYESPLFKEDFQAWIHGPVIPNLYSRYESFGWQDIKLNNYIDLEYSSLSDEDKEFLDEVAQEYLDCDDYELEQMIRIEEPWNKARGDLELDESCYEIIKKEWMKEYYGERGEEEE